jgi:hypothetical protein
MQTALRVSDDKATFRGLSLGKVYNVYSEANMVDVMLFNGTLLEKIQVLVSYASSRSGGAGLPVPKYFDNSGKEILMIDRADPLSPAGPGESDVWAVVGYLGGYLINAVVLGFLYPEECEVLCGRDSKGNEDGSMFLWKHDTTNAYVRVAKAYPNSGEAWEAPGKTGQGTPDIEINHPSGTIVKIGNVDYNAGFDGQRTPIVNWDSENQLRTFQPLNPVTEKADPAPSVLISHPSGTYAVIMPSGETWIHTPTGANLGIECGGDMTEEVFGDLTRTYHGKVTETIEKTYDQTVTGKVTQDFKDDLDFKVEGDATETFDKDVTENYQENFTRNVSGTEAVNATTIDDNAGTINIQASSVVNITGNPINLN